MIKMKNLGITAKSCELLTKHPNSRSYTYKIDILSKDLHIANNPKTWPDGNTINPYRPPDPSKQTGNGNKAPKRRGKYNVTAQRSFKHGKLLKAGMAQLSLLKMHHSACMGEDLIPTTLI